MVNLFHCIFDNICPAMGSNILHFFSLLFVLNLILFCEKKGKGQTKKRPGNFNFEINSDY